MLKNKANSSDDIRNTEYDIRHTSLEVVVEVFGFAVVAVVCFGVGGFGVDPDSLDPLGLFGVAVDGDQDAVQSHVTRGDLEWERHLRSERFQDVLDAPAEDGIVRAGHADIGDICGAVGQNPLVGGNDVGVRAETETDPAVEVIAHCDFLAGRLGVEIDDYDLGVLLDLRQDSVGRLVGAVTGLHKKTPYQGNNRNGRAFGGLVEGSAFAGRLLGEIGWPNYIIRRFQRRYDFPFAIGMVAQGNEVYAIPKQFIVYLPGQARAAGGVFGVGYDAVNVVLFDNELKLIGDNPSAGPTYYVTYTKNIKFHFRF